METLKESSLLKTFIPPAGSSGRGQRATARFNPRFSDNLSERAVRKDPKKIIDLAQFCELRIFMEKQFYFSHHTVTGTM